jgi:hypothetical protein
VKALGRAQIGWISKEYTGMLPVRLLVYLFVVRCCCCLFVCFFLSCRSYFVSELSCFPLTPRRRVAGPGCPRLGAGHCRGWHVCIHASRRGARTRNTAHRYAHATGIGFGFVSFRFIFIFLFIWFWNWFSDSDSEFGFGFVPFRLLLGLIPSDVQAM